MQNNVEINLVASLVTLVATAAALFLAGYFTLRHRLVLGAVSMLCFLALFRPSVAMASVEACKPHHYPDGDTLYFMRAGEEVRVRVAGFDAPERGQPYSRQATNKLRDLTGRGAQCQCYKQDRYGRSVCTVRTLSGDNVAAIMLGAGFGCIDPRFENEASGADRVAARAALDDAQRARRGMWSDRSPVCAVDYRRSQRAQ